MNENQLEQMADGIVATLAAAGAPVRVTGGKLLAETVKFRAVLLLGTRPSKVKAACRESTLAAGLAPARVTLGGGVIIEVARPDGGATTETMLASVKRRPYTAALGITDAGTPLLVNLESEAGAHVLIEGDGAADLVALIVEGLRRWNAPDALQVGPVDGQMDVLARGVARGRETRLPVLVALADRDSDALRFVLAGGPALGVHVILVVASAQAGLRALFPCRVRGLGDRTFTVNAPDWRGQFTLPPDGRRLSSSSVGAVATGKWI